MSILSASEVFQLAVKIEENGYRFYRTFSESLQDESLTKIFNELADEEVQHKRLFEEMLSTFESFEPQISYPDEYYAYLRAYADTLIFALDSLKQQVSHIKDAKAAVDFGIDRELDSIHYYQEIKSLVPEKERERIDTIIVEERKHFLKLSDLKKSV